MSKYEFFPYAVVALDVMAIVRRVLYVAGLWGAFVYGAAGVFAAPIELEISLTTGDVSLHNPNGGAFGIVGYSIVTLPGTLNPSDGVWTSITDTYDAPTGPTPGNGLVDSDDEWLELLSTPYLFGDLGEGVFTGDGGSLTAGQTLSLGHVWNTAVSPDPSIEVDVAQPTGLATVDVYYRYDSDFDENLVVNGVDYMIWLTNLGTGTLPSEGDADRDGDVDGDDFFVWQREVGLVGLSVFGAGAGSGTPSVATVPEPATVFLLVVGGAWLVARRRRRSR